MSKFAIIGGTGLNQMQGLQIVKTHSLETPFGKPSADYIEGLMNGKTVIFLARHGHPHHIAPHKINYRANIWGLKQLGVTDIIAIAAVGGITEYMAPAHMVIPDQLIDYSYGREHTFLAEETEAVQHIDFTYPYSPQLRQQLIEVAVSKQQKVSIKGTYGCTQGPRLESAGEIRRMQQDGCDLVGMTGMPEAGLARELELNYVCLAVVVNWAAGKSEGEITMAEIEFHLKQGMQDIHTLLQNFFID